MITTNKNKPPTMYQPISMTSCFVHYNTILKKKEFPCLKRKKNFI